MQSAIEYSQKNFDSFVQQLMDWLRIPSISTQPERAGDVQKAAEWLASDMRRIGLENIQIMPTKGHPVVYADWLHAGKDAPTVLVYGHYDVQPADIGDGWKHHPFEPSLSDGKLYARGATDDKGQVMIQLKAAEAMLATGECPVNVKYIIEGEEEIGSPNLTDFITENKDLLKADICLISDTGIRAEDQPSLVYGLRGLMTMELIVSGPLHDLHSGLGGMIHNPAQALAEIIAQLHDANGTVTVPGFYDDVRPLTETEREQLAQSELGAEEWKPMMGDLPAWGEADYSLIERSGARPTLEINGLASGYAGEGFKTVLPAHAIAKISCRLVPDQDPDRIFQLVSDAIHRLTPPTVRVEVKREGGGHPAITPIDHPAVQAAVLAYRANWDKDPLFLRGGGSIPVVADFQQILDLPVVLLGFALPDAQAHGPNESFHLTMYQKGISTVISYMHEVAN